jgi:hypothetical protein
MAANRDQSKPSWRARMLYFVIMVVALFTLGIGIYAIVNRGPSVDVGIR